MLAYDFLGVVLVVCAWNELLSILTQWMRLLVDRYQKDMPQEIRMRINSQPEIVLHNGSVWLMRSASREDMDYIMNAASRYSPWNASTICQLSLLRNSRIRCVKCVKLYTTRDFAISFCRCPVFFMRICHNQWQTLWQARLLFCLSLFLLTISGKGVLHGRKSHYIGKVNGTLYSIELKTAKSAKESFENVMKMIIENAAMELNYDDNAELIGIGNVDE